MNVPLAKQESNTEEDEKDEDVDQLHEEMTPEAIEAKKKRDEEEKFTKLFEGCKFFLSREVPKEQLVFVIRLVRYNQFFSQSLFLVFLEV